jgi:hypothetical protein
MCQAQADVSARKVWIGIVDANGEPSVHTSLAVGTFIISLAANRTSIRIHQLDEAPVSRESVSVSIVGAKGRELRWELRSCIEPLTMSVIARDSIAVIRTLLPRIVRLPATCRRGGETDKR